MKIPPIYLRVDFSSLGADLCEPDPYINTAVWTGIRLYLPCGRVLCRPAQSGESPLFHLPDTVKCPARTVGAGQDTINLLNGHLYCNTGEKEDCPGIG